MSNDVPKSSGQNIPSDGKPNHKPTPGVHSEAEDLKRDIGSRPPAGPHARDDLTNPDATPGSGVLPDDRRDGEVDPGAG